MVPWSNGNDAWLTSRRRWFNSIRDHLAQIRQPAERLSLNRSVCEFESHSGHTNRLGRQLADHLGLEPGMPWGRVPPEPLKTTRPRGAVRSARHPVKVEIMGSNPIGDASTTWHGTPTGRATDFKRPWLWVRLPPVLLTTKCVGWALASPGGCNPPACGLWRFNSVPAH